MRKLTNNPTARVEVVLPGALYRLTLEDLSLREDPEIIAHLAGKMKRARIQLLVGDRVEVVLDPYLGKITNRIEWRK